MNLNSPGELTIEKEYKWVVSNQKVFVQLKQLKQFGGMEVSNKSEVFQKDFYFHYFEQDDSYIRVRQIKSNERLEYFVTCKGPLSKTIDSLSRVQREFPVTEEEFNYLIANPTRIYQFRKLASLPAVQKFLEEKIPILGLWIFNLRTKMALFKDEEKGFLYLDQIMFSNDPQKPFKPTEYEIEFEPTSRDDFGELLSFINSFPGVSPISESKVGRYLKNKR